MWIDGHWFPKDLVGQLLIVWLFGVGIAAVLIWRLGRKSKKRSRVAARTKTAKRSGNRK